jgi:putative Mn2+ efflux pump MntP
MPFIEIILIAIGLSADAFSVSLGNGIASPRANAGRALMTAAFFGIFQAAMPLAGYLAGSMFSEYIENYDHIVALILLGFIGGKMVFGGIKSMQGDVAASEVKAVSLGSAMLSLLVQAVATSIDALIVGVGFAAMGMTLPACIRAVLLIGAVTFALSFVGVLVGKRLGALLGPKAEIAGGLVLIAIGVKIFVEHVMG